VSQQESATPVPGQNPPVSPGETSPDGTAASPDETPAGQEQAAPVEPTGPAGLTPDEAALVAEACTKSGVVWVRPSGEDRWHPAWHAWHDSAVHLVFGTGEQMLPLLTGDVDVAVPSKDTGSLLVTVRTLAEVLPARTPGWEAAADALSAKRLNATDPDRQRERWASGALLARLTPLRLLSAGPGDDGTPAGASSPVATPATTGGRAPFHLGGRRRRLRRPSR